MLDALELKGLSESLQSRDITLSHAVNMIKRNLMFFWPDNTILDQGHRQAAEASVG